jgi:hypothetical protein
MAASSSAGNGEDHQVKKGIQNDAFQKYSCANYGNGRALRCRSVTHRLRQIPGRNSNRNANRNTNRSTTDGFAVTSTNRSINGSTDYGADRSSHGCAIGSAGQFRLSRSHNAPRVGRRVFGEHARFGEMDGAQQFDVRRR